MEYFVAAKKIVDVIKGVPDVTYRLWTCAWDLQIEDILNDLETSMGDLKKQRDRVLKKVLAEEGRLKVRISSVSGWLEEVERMERVVDLTLEKGKIQLQRRCLGGCYPISCWDSYEVSRAVKKNLPLVKELKERGVFDVVAEKQPRLPVQPVPEDPNDGLESTTRTIWKFIENADIGIIGLYGMPGVGKTAVLKKINNEFENTIHEFDFVVLLEITKNVNHGIIIKKIGECLGLPEDKDATADDIFNVLRCKKSVILLDDLWKRLDLRSIGIPPTPVNGSKIVFTTRNELVCHWMDVDKKLRMECLNEDQAWTLFATKVGQETLTCHPDIQDLAKTVAKRCGGLPIALIVIGRSMANKKMPGQWRTAISALQKQEFQHMGEVFRLSKFSYDELPSESIRSCFLFCSLYPEGQSIFIEDLIKRWIGKGYIEMDGVDDWNTAVDTGYYNVGVLKEACLLDSYEERARNVAKMHDVVRDLALWIACECGKETDKFLVEGSELTEARVTEKWKRAHCISLSSTKITQLRDTPNCPNLSILLLSDNIYLTQIHNDFFNHLHALTYLDLSKSGTTKLPKSIGELNLLEYLDLSDTGVRELPCEMKNLVKLMYLFLAHMRNVPGSLITRLSNLKLLKFNERKPGDLEGDRWGEIHSIECAENTRKALRIKNSDAEALNFLLRRGLIHCAESLFIEFEVHQDPSSVVNTAVISPASSSNCKPVSLTCISNLIVYWELNCLGPCFRNLHSVSISSCNVVVNIAWVLDVPNIQALEVQSCRNFKEIIPVDSGEWDAFQKLRRLILRDLPCLTSICGNILSFPDLEQIEVTKCPMLKKLPLDFASAANNKLQSIRGDHEWWNNLDWENTVTKTKFRSYVLFTIVCPVFV